MAKISELEDELKKEDKNTETIKAKMEEINKDAQALFAEMYQNMSPEEQAAAQAQAGAAGAAPGQETPNAPEDGVVDVESEEKSDKKD